MNRLTTESRKPQYDRISNSRNIQHPLILNQQLPDYTTAMKYHSERKKPTSTTHPKAQSRQRDNVKFECNDYYPKRNVRQEQEKKLTSYGNYSAQNKELYDTIANDNIYNSCMESEIDSVYSSSCYHDEVESETESLAETDDYTRKALQQMETKVNTITNRFVNRVKSQVDETFSKLKIQSKCQKVKAKCPKNQRGGSGDGSNESKLTVESDEMIKKMLEVKKDCYDQIQKNLKRLQHVDYLTDKLYQNYTSP